MNELQVKTIKLEPAIVEFNHLEIEEELNQSLASYKDLIFNEENTTELRSTLAYLRKGKKSVDDYRKETEKTLTKSVTDFKAQIKNLTSQFDSVIDPLNDQLKEFTEIEKEKKLNDIKAIREELINLHVLDQEYHERVAIEPQYTNKSTSMSIIKDSIEFQIKNLKMEQEKKEADKQNITMFVKLTNAELGTSLGESTYIRLLEFEEAKRINEIIEEDAAQEVRLMLEKEQREAARIEKEKLEKERIEAEQKEVEEVAEVEAETPFIIEDVSFIEDVPLYDPFEDIQPVEVEAEVFKQTYVVHANDSDLKKLQDFMDNNNIQWGFFE